MNGQLAKVLPTKGWKRLMKKIIGIVIGVVIIAFLVIGISRTRQTEEVLSIAKIQKNEGVPVLVANVVNETVRSTRNYYGTVRTKEQALVASKMMERIEKIEVKVGDTVKKGDVLVRFEKDATQASLHQAELAYKNAKLDYERMQNLLDEGAISQQTFDQVKLGYEVSKENYLTSLSAVELVSPIDGVVARIDFENGQVAFPGDVVVKVVDERDYEISFEVTQEDRVLLKKGQKVTVSYGNDMQTTGEISRVSRATSDMTRLFTAHADIMPSEGLYPGILGTVSVVVQHREDALSIPNDAILNRGEGDFVFVIQDGKVKSRFVEIGLIGEERSEIVGGLTSGEVVGVYGHVNLEDDVLIKIIEDRQSL